MWAQRVIGRVGVLEAMASPSRCLETGLLCFWPQRSVFGLEGIFFVVSM